eukprot:766499-Hanusia_phi.AAC.1
MFVPHRCLLQKKLVVIGSGWGSHALMKNVDASQYDATIISPRNYFLFTPMLAGEFGADVDSGVAVEVIVDTTMMCWW